MQVNKGHKLLCSGYEFDEGKPYLLLDELDSADSIKRIRFSLLNRVITIIRLKGRYCTGSYDLESLTSFPCHRATKLPPDSKHTSCFACKQKTGFNPAFYNSKAISPQQQVYNEEPHVVYLAAFGNGLIKVGISLKKRVRIRLLEQGARAATILKECANAYLAREIESQICKTTNIREMVSVKVKKQLLANRQFTFDDMEADLLNAMKQLGKRYSFGMEMLSIESLDSYYYTEHPINGKIEDIDKRTPLSISGRCVAQIGSLCIFENDHNLYMISAQSLKSHLIQFIEDHIQIMEPAERQMNLF